MNIRAVKSGAITVAATLGFSSTGGPINRILGVYTNTTASAANVSVNSNGNLARSTSSLKYKTDVENIELSIAKNIVSKLNPIFYRSTCESDNKGWSWYGLGAEDVAAIEPRLVFWGRPNKEIVTINERQLENGEIVEEKTLTYEPDLDKPLEAEGVQYDRIVAMLIKVAQDQEKRIKALEKQIKEVQ